MKKLIILIPSYKRPEVLRATLTGLYDNTSQDDGYNVTIALGLNKAMSDDIKIASDFKVLFGESGIPFKHIQYEENVGKAKILNVLFKLYAEESDYIVTMDNDMVIKMPWLYQISIADKIDYDIMGFSSAMFWAHDPVREKCSFVSVEENLFYKPHSVAGGMMLFHSNFLKENKWTNHGGVYGREDADMCLRTDKKYVLFSDKDWLVHDPFSCTTPLLKSYEDKKKQLYKIGKFIFPEGWDEEDSKKRV